MRNNERRLGAGAAPQSNAGAVIAAQDQQSSLSYVTPTEFVELPSKGCFYPEGHLLHDQKTIEIRFMTAKEEDIISSVTLAKNGLMLDRLLQSLLVDKTIDPASLLVGDRNAIMIAARKSAYGQMYETSVTCPACGEEGEFTFDLDIFQVNENCFDEEYLSSQGLEYDPQKAIFKLALPLSKATVGLALLTGADEAKVEKIVLSAQDNLITSALKSFVVSVDGHENPADISQFVDSLPAADSRAIRKAYKNLAPDIKLEHPYACMSCLHRTDLEVPLRADFFWLD